ncbi:MAG: YdiU family protein [Oligoflexales bacterium]
MDILSHLSPAHSYMNHFSEEKENMWSPLEPYTFPNPSLIALSNAAFQILDLDPSAANHHDFLKLFSGGDSLHPTYATCYGGHQFGHWAGQLGDGRAMHIGEYTNSKQEHWDLQLKGSGPTPYSRGADGKAVLRSSIREFLCSEAMFHLGVPTTRALCLLRTGENIVRDKLYNGNPAEEPGAVVCRLSPSFLRFGHFEILAAKKQHDLLRKLISFTINRDFSHLSNHHNPMGAWFHEVCIKTATLMAHWQRVGFVHGVMNTDNMSILGLTIDYGPYGWIEPYDPAHTPNTTDLPGRRYAFEQQPEIALWNLGCLANALATVCSDHKPLYEGIDAYKNHFYEQSNAMTSQKFGFHSDVQHISQKCFELMEKTSCDHTLFFRHLATPLSQLNLNSLSEAFYAPINESDQKAWRQWLTTYKTLVSQEHDDASRIKMMNTTNPCYILRNSMVHTAILNAEAGDNVELHKILAIIQNPYEEKKELSLYTQKRPEWAQGTFGCSTLSCSS